MMLRRLFWIVFVCCWYCSLALRRSTVDQAKSLLRQAAGPVGSDQFMNWAGRMVQLWFHDSDTFGVATNGGPNGCVNTMMGANAGVLGVIQKIDQIRLQLGFAMSKADLIVLGASCVIMDSIPKGTPVGMDLLGNFMTGRPDVFFCDFQNVLPNPTGDISTVQQAVGSRLGLNMAETVALMGAHTLGGAHQSISGFSGAFDDTPGAFDNLYFTSYLTKQWVKTQNQGGVFWAASDNSQNIRFNVDMAMAIDTRTCQVNRGCPAQPQGTMDWIKLFANDPVQWHKNFASAFQKVSSNGVRGLVPLGQLKP